MKNKVKLIIIIAILFLNVFLYIIPNSYKKEYKISKHNITEKYIKKDNMYLFDIKANGDVFHVALNSKYKAKKKLIKNIKKIEIENGYCLLVKSDKLDFYPLCKQDNEYKSFYLIDELKDKISSSYYKTIDDEKSTYQSLDLYYLNNKNYLLWNYNYFYYINNDTKEKINVFNKDYYEIDLATKLNNYLFIPNYDDGYSFNNASIINMKNGKIENWDTKYDISMDSRILGTYKKSIYLLDEKNKVLYEIVPHKKKIRKISGRILENGKLKKYNINTIINDKLSFESSGYYDYQVIKNKLYLVNDQNKTLLNNDNVTRIIYIDNDTVYYLIKDTLYMYNPYYGNIKVISNFEWEFNNKNMIFIY